MTTEVKIPANYTEAIKLINESGKTVRWDFYTKSPNQICEKMYDMYSPIAYIYEENELKYAAHFKHNKVMAYDVNDVLVELSNEQNILIEKNIKAV
jgi:hypothetical protein